MKSQSRNRSSGGYALVMVLVGVALLSLIVEAALLISMRSVRSVSTDLVRAQLECADDSAISEGMLTLVDTMPGSNWPVDGTPQDIFFNGFSVEVIIQGEAGKIDLNGSDRELILGLFSAAGLDNTVANTLADRVLDWREPGPLKRLNGAKAADYRAAGLPYGPRGGPFQSIDELKLVLGITPALYRLLEPSITVYSVLPIPELQMASPIALRATGMALATIEAVMAARARGEVAPELGDLGPNSVRRIPGLPGTVFTISAAAHWRDIRVVRTEVVRFTGNPKNPFVILAFR